METAEEILVAERSNGRGEGIFVVKQKNELQVASASVAKGVIVHN
jgi:hypothetical protein